MRMAVPVPHRVTGLPAPITRTEEIEENMKRHDATTDYTAGGIWYLVAAPISPRKYFWFRSKAALRQRFHRRDTLSYHDHQCLGVL